MGRKNQRSDEYVPLDLTPAEAPKRSRPTERVSYRQSQERRADEDRERFERQRLARVNQGIDWSLCIVPGCASTLTFAGLPTTARANRRDSTLELPICFEHASVIWKQMVEFHTKDPRFVEAIADLNDRLGQQHAEEHAETQRAFLAREDGEIYFVRIGGLVKVGWTRDLWSRLKSYGASAELLVSYPATRQDETNLHRQLTPARAKGREWYEDGAVIAKFLDEALARYGIPRGFDDMWTTPKQVVAGKRHR